jgi:hypothetical protein
MFKKLIIAFSVLIILTSAALLSQEEREIELTAQAIVARVDRVMQFPEGLMKGSIKHIFPDGRSYVSELNGQISKEDFLFTFSSRERGNQLKVLYNLGGEDIWVYNIHSLKLFHKMGIDKYDLILSTNFSFIDLSNADLQSNYTATIVGDASIKGIDTYKLVLKPIFRGGEYGSLTLYATKDKYLPMRIDFHDRDNMIFKFMSIVRTMEKGDRVIPVRYDMMDIRKGTISILSFTSFDEKARFDREIFRSNKLGE